MAITALQQPGAVDGLFTDKIWGLNNSRLFRPRSLGEAGASADEEAAIDATGELFKS